MIVSMVRNDRKNTLDSLWTCPQCGTTVKTRPRMSTNDNGTRKFVGQYLSCPNAYTRTSAVECDYALSPEGMEKFLRGDGTLRSVGSGKVFRLHVLGEDAEE